MVTIEIDGVKVEADTLSEAQRLARKEQKRQNAIREERNAKGELARTYAYAQIGRWANRLDDSDTMCPAHAPTTRETEYGKLFFARQVKCGGEDGDTLKVESEQGTGEYQLCGYQIIALVENGAGYSLAAKIHSTRYTEEADHYLAFHAVDDVVAAVKVPKYIGAALDRAMAKRLEKIERAKEVAA